MKKTGQAVAGVFAFCYLSSMRPLESLTLESIVSLLSGTFQRFPDSRHPDRVAFQVHDTLMSGFACMFFQHRSLLEFQRRMKERRGRCNLETLFGVTQVPSDSQMREILDPLPTALLRQLLPVLFEEIRRAGWAKLFKTQLVTGNTSGNYYCVALDGTQYFHSTKLECPSCLIKTDASGQVHYSHSVVAATLVKAGSHKVLPLDVEPVQNSDGQDKQDCELNAAKRLVKRLRGEHRQMEVIITGDDLYSHEPMVELLTSQRFHCYELEHNYGHGKKNLSQVFYLLNLLAYVTHIILEMGDRLYQRSRERASRRELWGDLRSLMKTRLVESWQQILRINLDEETASP